MSKEFCKFCHSAALPQSTEETVKDLMAASKGGSVVSAKNCSCDKVPTGITVLKLDSGKQIRLFGHDGENEIKPGDGVKIVLAKYKGAQRFDLSISRRSSTVTTRSFENGHFRNLR